MAKAKQFSAEDYHVGDQDLSAQLDQTPQQLIYSTPLTADRTLTLPNALPGTKWHITRPFEGEAQASKMAASKSAAPRVAKPQPITQAYVTTRDGEVIENIIIDFREGNALHVKHNGCKIRNVEVHHDKGKGVYIDADNCEIETILVKCHSNVQGIDPGPNESWSNIYGYGARGTRINNAILEDGSTGILMDRCPDTQIRKVNGYRFHGPMPRGQLIQLTNDSDDCIIEDVMSECPPNEAHTEDTINLYHVKRIQIRRAYLWGNNSPSGQMVIAENGTEDVIVEDVDCIEAFNGVCLAGQGQPSKNITFRRIRSFRQYAHDIGRGKASSDNGGNGPLMYGAFPGNINIRFEQCTYTDPDGTTNVQWDGDGAATMDIKEDPNAEPREPYIVQPPAWDGDGTDPEPEPGPEPGNEFSLNVGPDVVVLQEGEWVTVMHDGNEYVMTEFGVLA